METIPNNLSAPETIAQQVERYDQIAHMAAIISELWTGVSDPIKPNVDDMLNHAAADVQFAARQASSEAERLPKCLRDIDQRDCLRQTQAYARRAMRSLTEVWQSYEEPPLPSFYSADREEVMLNE